MKLGKGKQMKHTWWVSPHARDRSIFRVSGSSASRATIRYIATNELATSQLESITSQEMAVIPCMTDTTRYYAAYRRSPRSSTSTKLWLCVELQGWLAGICQLACILHGLWSDWSTTLAII